MTAFFHHRFRHVPALLVMLFMWLGNALAQENAHKLLSFTVADGLPSSKVHQALQDPAGYMWFATSAGVVRFDGERFETFTVNDGLTKNDVPAMMQDQDGAIWLMTIGALTHYQDGVFQKRDSIQYIKDARILNMKQSLDGGKWLQTSGYLFFLPAGETIPRQINDLMAPAGMLRLLFTDDQNFLWCYQPGMLLCFQEDQLVSRIPLSTRLAASRFAAVPLRNGKMIYNGEDGLYLLERSGVSRPVSTPAPPEKWANGVSSILQDQDGKIWLSFPDAKGGVCVFRLSEDGLYMEPEIDLLDSIRVQHIFEDRETNLWFSTQNDGLFLLLASARSMIRQNSLFRSSLSGISGSENGAWISSAADTAGNLLLTSESGKVFRLKRKADLAPELQFSFPGTVVKSLRLPDGGTLAVGQDGSLWREQGGRIFTLSLFREIKNIFLIGADIFLDGGYLNGSFRFPHEMLDALSDKGLDGGAGLQIDSLSFSRITDVVKDNEGNIWIADLEGLTKILPDGTEQNHGLNLNALDARIDALEVGPKGEVFVGTNGSGVVVFKGNKTIVLDQSNGLGSNVCKSLNTGPDGVWAGTNRGLARITEVDFKTNYARVQLFSDKDGLAARSVDAIQTVDQGLLLKQRGELILFPSPEKEISRVRPEVYIREVRAKNKVLPLKEFYQLPADSNDIEIYFTGIAFLYLDNLDFEYQLNAGDNPEWKPIRNRFVRFPTLPSGTYTFMVRARTPDGLRSNPQVVLIEIKPEFYRSWWFLSLVGLIFLVVLFLFFRYLYSERQRMELEIRVDEKTFELQQKVAELHRTNEDLERFAYVASHDLKTPLRTVISHLQLLERQYKKDLDSAAVEYIDFAVGSSRRMYDMINDLLAYAKVGRDQASMETVRLEKVVGQVEKSLSSLLKDRNAQIVYGELPVINGIRSQWQTLFQNLIENGVKFNRSEAPRIEISAKESPSYWMITVKDNGIGIAEEYQHKIFEIFQRLYTDAEFPGTGIGLAICKRIVEAHNGSIWIESSNGDGTSFHFTIEKVEKD